MMREIKLRGFAHAVVLALALGSMQCAMADDAVDNGNKAILDKLQVDLKRLEVAEKELGLVKNATPEPSPLQKPEAAKAEATTTRLAFLQSSELAGQLVGQLQPHLRGQQKVLIESPNLLHYLAANDSVDALLHASERAVAKETETLESLSGAALASVAPVVATAVMIAQSGFAIASAARTKIAFVSGTDHSTLATKVLQAELVRALGSKVQVYDPDAYLPLASSILDTRMAGLTQALKQSERSLQAAGARSKNLRSTEGKTKGQIASDAKEAALLDEQIKVLAGVMVQAEKYQLSLHAMNDAGVTPLVEAKRGEWLKGLFKESSDIPRLSVSSISSAFDIIAADGWVKGVRVAAAANTIAQWRLVKADGSVVSGAAQSCLAKGDVCARVVLRADDFVK